MSTDDKNDQYERLVGPKYQNYIWSILFSPIFVGIFFAIYFQKKKNYNGLFTVLGLILTFILLVVLKAVYTNWDQFWIPILLNIIFTIVFLEFMWKRYFYLSYKNWNRSQQWLSATGREIEHERSLLQRMEIVNWKKNANKCPVWRLAVALGVIE